MKPLLIDTGCIVALLDRSERNLLHCVEALANTRSTLVTCEAVIAESCYLLRNLPGAGQAVLENVEKGILRIPLSLAGQARSVRRLIHKYHDVPMDLADACLERLAEMLDTPKIMTLDSDFDIYRWGRNRRFEILPSHQS